MSARWCGRERARGQALVEFSLAALVLFSLLLGIVQFGFLFGGQVGFTNAVRDTARYATTCRVGDASDPTGCAATTTAACTKIRTQLLADLGEEVAGFAASRLTATISYTSIANADGSTYSTHVVISATYRHPLYVPLVGVFVDGLDGAPDGSFALGANEQMRVESAKQLTSGGTVTCS